MTLYNILNYLLEPLAYFIYFISVSWYLRSHQSVKWRALAIYYFLATVLMVRAAYASSNIEIYKLLCLLTFTGVGIYFYYTFISVLKKRIVIALGLLHAAYYIAQSLVVSNPAVFDSMGYVFLASSVVVLVFLYMHQLLTNVTEAPLSHSVDFWFVSFQLIYHIGGFVIFLTYRYLTQRIMTEENYSAENRLLISNVWVVHNVLLFLSAILFAISLVWISYRRKSPSS